MRVKKPFVMCLPGLCTSRLEELCKANEPQKKYNILNFYYLINYLSIRQNQARKDVKNKGFYTINFKNLNKVIGYNAKKYIKLLLDRGLLYRDFYIEKERSYHYKLNEEYLKGYVMKEIPCDSKLYLKMNAKNKRDKSHDNRDEEHIKLMRKKFNKLKMDYGAMEHWISTSADISKQYVYFNSLLMLKDKRMRYFKICETNQRLNSNLTNLKSELRDFMIGDFFSIDLSNSQPYLLSEMLIVLHQFAVMKGSSAGLPLRCEFVNNSFVKGFENKVIKACSKILQNDLFFKNGELLNLHRSCSKGAFYNDILKQYTDKKLSRKEAKEMMFAVLFSRNVSTTKKGSSFIPYAKEKAVFAKLYPTTSNLVEVLKQYDHSKLAIFLQKSEANIFINTICPKLIENNIIPFTIHDSIIVEREYKDQALAIVREVFLQLFNNVPSFDIKPLGTYSNQLAS